MNARRLMWIAFTVAAGLGLAKSLALAAEGRWCPAGQNDGCGMGSGAGGGLGAFVGRFFGDPIGLTDQNTQYSHVDLTFKSWNGYLSFVRMFNSSPGSFTTTESSGVPRREMLEAALPGPFGKPGPTTINWWHNYYSFIRVGLGTDDRLFYSVVEPSGFAASFIQENTSGKCERSSGSGTQPDDVMVPNGEGSKGLRNRLLRKQDCTFVYFVDGGGRFVYASPGIDSIENPDSEWLYFLTRVEDINGEPLLDVDYARPMPGGSPCPNEFDQSPEGYPYIDKVYSLTKLAGSERRDANLRFDWAKTGPAGSCVLSQLHLKPSGLPEQKVVEYHYSSGGFLDGVQLFENSDAPTKVLGYEYSEPNYDPAFKVAAGGTPPGYSSPPASVVMNHVFPPTSQWAKEASWGAMGGDAGLGYDYQVSYLDSAPPNTCQTVCDFAFESGNGPDGGTFIANTFVDKRGRRGDGSRASTTVKEIHMMGNDSGSNVLHGARLHRSFRICQEHGDKECSGSERHISWRVMYGPGYVETVTACRLLADPTADAGEGGGGLGDLDECSFDNYFAQLPAGSADAGGPPAQMMETTASYPNAQAPQQATDGGTAYTFTYGPNAENGQAFGNNSEQLLASEARHSVAGGGGWATTSYLYDGTGRTPNRVNTVARTGVTRRNGAVSSETIKTFHTADGMGRPSIVDGPCYTAGTSCVGPRPITEYTYYPDDPSSNSSNRLESIKKIKNLGGGYLITEFSAYDLLGNPTEIRRRECDEANCSPSDDYLSSLAYEGNRVVSETNAAGERTEYGYDNGKPYWMKLPWPENRYLVACHRESPAGGACSTLDAFREAPKFIAKSSSSTGSPWSERIELEYDAGTLRKRSYYACLDLVNGCTSLTVNAERRRVEVFEGDAQRRPTWRGWGAVPGSGADITTFPYAQFSQVARFDHRDRLTGLGLPFNAPATESPSDPWAWCGGKDSNTKRCKTFGYDQANNLARVEEYASTSDTEPLVTCFSYDLDGNVTGVVAGCQTSADCSSLPQSCNDVAYSYRYDDFGRLMEATVPGGGTYAYEYDASGNLVRRDAPGLASGYYYAYEYDGVGRRLKTMVRAGAKISSSTRQASVYAFACSEMRNWKRRS